MTVPAFLLKFRPGSSMCTSLPKNKDRESAWQRRSGWFNFTVVQSILSASPGEAQLSGCVFRGWPTTTVRRALQQRALRDSATIVFLGLLSFTASSCHRKQVAVPLPPQPEPATAVEAPQKQPAAPAPLPSSVAAPPPPVLS